MLSQADLAARTAKLGAIERGSGSAGQRRAADLIADELRELGADVTTMDEIVHGTYWRPLGVLSLLTLAAAAARSRAIALLAAWGAADDLELGSRRLRGRLGLRRCRNVLARVGSPEPEHVLLVHVHHDAAHTGLVFHPALARALAPVLGRIRSTPPLLWGMVVAPLLVAAGLRRTGATAALGNALAMIDIGRSRVVPGANDNLSGVAAGLSLFHALVADPPSRIAVVLFSSGSEESFLEGFDAFRRRGFPGLPADRTACLCLETVGSPRLMTLDGEGLLRLWRYPPEMRRVVEECARERGIDLDEPFRFRFATGGQVTLRAGIPTAVLSSLDRDNVPRNSHWPSDAPEALDYGSVARAAELAQAVVRRLDERWL